jgi:hypothetical protein
MNAKQTVLADETLFQRACSEWVNRNIGHCVSSLMSNVGNNLSTCAEIFDFDEDDARSWFETPDNEEAVRYFIMEEADFDQLAEAAEIAGYWDDVLSSCGIPDAIQKEKDELEREIGLLDVQMDDTSDEDLYRRLTGERELLQDQLDELDDLEAYVNAQDKMKNVRQAVRNLFTEPDEYARAVSEFNLEPEYSEIYEHWVCESRWSADDLQAQGETVFEFCNLWIWARGTTGQSVSQDSVIRRITRDLPEDHYIWNHVL